MIVSDLKRMVAQTAALEESVLKLQAVSGLTVDELTALHAAGRVTIAPAEPLKLGVADCTCVCHDPGSHLEPPCWEQDPNCRVHPEPLELLLSSIDSWEAGRYDPPDAAELLRVCVRLKAAVLARDELIARAHDTLGAAPTFTEHRPTPWPG